MSAYQEPRHPSDPRKRGGRIRDVADEPIEIEVRGDLRRGVVFSVNPRAKPGERVTLRAVEPE